MKILVYKMVHNFNLLYAGHILYLLYGHLAIVFSRYLFWTNRVENLWQLALGVGDSHNLKLEPMNQDL